MTTQEEFIEYVKIRSDEIKERATKEGCVDDETYKAINSIIYRLLSDWSENLE